MNETTERYHFREAEAQWQQRWDAEQVFKATKQNDQPKYYVLEMFPYPSGNIHMGHVRNYSLGDVMARTKRMQGYNVLHPMGWDAFGLPAENAAIQNNSHPEGWTLQNIETMREQLKMIGLSYDWDREFATCLPDYYQHEQRFFLEFLKKGIAYRKEAEVNWDPVDHTVLANEQVIDGRGWRSGAVVERRKLSQWFLRISDYAEDLLQAIDTLDQWPEKVRIMQDRWIGKSFGATLYFTIKGRDEKLEVYTTRPDTIFGMGFCAISSGHPLAEALAKTDKKAEAFIKECQQLGTSEEALEKAEKKGYDTGLRIEHPFGGSDVALYIANFVLMDYGSGAIFGCPAHDQRDLDFARKYDLPVTTVVAPSAEEADFTVGNDAYTGSGIIVNSDFLNGLSIDDAKQEVIKRAEENGFGKSKVNYRLRDWGVSRQRYWGCPIPIIYCDDCGAVPVPDDQLPVELPKDISFEKPGNPLDHHPSWKHVDCPSCHKPATRETDTFDTFFESSWYFGRFCTPHSDQPFEKNELSYWMPVDCYIGGVEHAVLHLLYARFFSRALNDCGLVDYKEPFKRLETQGMICHETYKSQDDKWLFPDDINRTAEGATTLDGAPVTVGRVEKMSKSKKNTVDPRHIIKAYGADAARLFMLSDSPPERDLEWTDAGIDGAWRYINRVWRLVTEKKDALKNANSALLSSLSDERHIALRKATHKTIKAVTEQIEQFHYNKAIAKIRELTNLLGDAPCDTPEAIAAYHEAISAALHLMCPFIPHLAEELWKELGHDTLLSTSSWPKADESLTVDDVITIGVQINGKLRGTLEISKTASKDETEQQALAIPNVIESLKGKTIVKTIVVPGRIVNVVAK